MAKYFVLSQLVLRPHGLFRLRRSCTYGGVAFLLWLLACWPSLALELRVAIQESGSQVRVGTSSTGVVRDRTGAPVGRIAGGQSLIVSARGSQLQAGDWASSAFWVEPGTDGYVFIKDRWYRGRVLVSADQNSVMAVNYVDLDQYLYSVVGGEMPSSWPLEALKAQAIAARSYALYRRQRSSSSHYDIGRTTTWQVYGGLEDEASNTRAAVDLTRHQVLTYNGQIIEAVFHSSSGGHTENVEDVWSQPLPYLRGVQDFDAGAPVYQWHEILSLGEINQRVPEIGRLLKVVPRRRTPRGRVQEIQLEGDRGSRVMSGNDFRRAFDLRSTLFSLTLAGEQLQIAGRGFGHGIGMSQWGAHNLAQQGYTYQQILGHYYRGAQLSRIALASANQP